MVTESTGNVKETNFNGARSTYDLVVEGSDLVVEKNLLNKIKETIMTENNNAKKRTDRQRMDTLFVNFLMDLLTEKDELELAIKEIIRPVSQLPDM